MDWRLLVAAVMVLATLAGGTVLVAQVEQDLQASFGAPVEETFVEPPDDLPFKLKGLKLPDSLPLKLPEGTTVSPDLDKLTLPEDMDVSLPENMDLSGLNFDLPEDFALDLPPGTTFDGSKLTLPDGATFRLPDGSQFTVPPGTSLDLPPEVARRLMEQGLPIGTLPSARGFRFSDLPPGLNVGVDPPTLTGGGTLRLPAGTEIVLPPGVPLPPGVTPGHLAYAVQTLLPPGTQFNVPLPDGTTLRGVAGGQMPIPEPREPPARPPPGAPAAASDDRVRLETEIDRHPQRARKGETFRVEGYVREEATGRGVFGAPVEIFLNETKTTPGTLLARTSSDASGRFSVNVDLPQDRPARQWQLVNHAGAFTSSAGVSYADAWGDPPMYTYSSTTVSLDLPDRVPLGTQTVLQGRLQDGVGAPVSSVLVEVMVDNRTIGHATTRSDGVFHVSHTFAAAGVSVVEARFNGASPYYEPSGPTRVRVLVEDVPSIEHAGPMSVLRGHTTVLAGRALLNAQPAPFAEVDVSTSFGGSTRVTTDATGRFAHAVAIPRDQPLGRMNVVYVFLGQGIAETQVLTVETKGVLDVSAPAAVSLKGLGVPVEATLVDDAGAPIPGVPVTVRLAGPGGSRELSDVPDPATGKARFLLQPPVAVPGDYVVTAFVAPAHHVSASAAPLAVKMGDVEARWSLPEQVVRGRDVRVEATFAYAGAPLAAAEVRLSLFGNRTALTDAAGRATWTLPVPTGAPVGAHKATLTAPGLQGEPSSKETRVVAVPVLGLETPASFDPAKGVRANVSVVDDARAPMPSVPVTVTMRAGNWTRTQQVVTDGRGAWTGTLGTDGAPAANLTLTARHEASPTALPAESTRILAASVEPVPVDAGAPSWLLPLGVVAVLGGAGGSAWLLRGRLRKKPSEAVSVPVAAPPPAPARTADLDLRLGIPEGEPLLWGVGEPLGVAVRSSGTVRPGSVVLVGGEGSESPHHLDAEGHAATTLVPTREGHLRVVARRPDEPASLPVEVRVEVVDYRKAVAREFDALVARAGALGLDVTRRSTPREVEAALVTRLGESAAPLLDEIALLMEVTNYSQAPVSRREFLRFLGAASRLHALLGPAEE